MGKNKNIPVELLDIPEWARDWPLDQLPMGARTRSALAEVLGIRLLGELHGQSKDSLLGIRNFGNKAREDLFGLIGRIRDGRYGTSSIAEGFREVSAFNSAIVFLKTYLDEQVASLNERDRNIIERRLGLKSGQPETLDEIGKKHGVVRYAISLVVDEKIRPVLMTNGGPRVQLALKTVTESLELNCEPLKEAHHYAALIKFMDPAVPVLAELPACYRTGSDIDYECASNILREWAGCRGRISLELVEACRILVSDIPGMTAAAFYDHVRDLKGFELDGGVLQSRTRPPGMREIAYAVLEASDRPLTGPEILSRAELMGLVSTKDYSPSTVLNLVSHCKEKCFILLGAHKIGLKKHIRLHPGLWEDARSEFDDYLRKLGRPAPVGAFLQASKKVWASKTSIYELAAIMDLDEQNRFVRAAKKMVFGRSADGIGVYATPEIEDLIMDHLAIVGEADLGELQTIVNKARKTRAVSAVLRKMMLEGTLHKDGVFFRRNG